MLRTLGPCLAIAAVAAIPAVFSAPAGATTPPAAPAPLQDVQIETIPVAGNVSMLLGQGGNIGVCVGEDGAFLIDDQFAPLTDKILAAVGELTDQPVKFLVNTHWHFDHTGGNENMGNAGVVLVAQENVRARMSVDQVMETFGREVPAAPAAALPKITFTDEVTFYWNDEEIEIFHVPSAHTDGDAIIHFKGADVFHMGDTYFNGFYPFIDYGSGGSIEGVIAAANRVLAQCGDDTLIIPGHGPLSNPAELRTFRDMLADVQGRMAKLIASGSSREEVIAARPTQAWDEVWGDGFIPTDDWVGMIYDGMTSGS